MFGVSYSLVLHMDTPLWLYLEYGSGLLRRGLLSNVVSVTSQGVGPGTLIQVRRFCVCMKIISYYIESQTHIVLFLVYEYRHNFKELKQMGLQVDDVFRMVEMTIFLCILLPISVRWFATKWHAGVHLHRLVNLVYFVDIVRRHSHPHSWILNTPVFVLYLLDKHVFTYFYKRNKSPAMRRVRLGEDFMVLYWGSPYGFTDTVGPDYSLLMNNSSFLEQKHVFTCFENRSGKGLEDTNQEEDEDGVDSYANEADDSDSHKWTVGVVIRVFRRPRSPVLGAKDRVSHTQRMYEEEPIMLVTGSRQGEMSEMVRSISLRSVVCFFFVIWHQNQNSSYSLIIPTCFAHLTDTPRAIA